MEYIEDDALALKMSIRRSTIDRCEQVKIDKKKRDSLMRLFISQKRLDYIYERELEKVKRYHIIINDSDSGLNILWSQSRAKLYFIDFENWDLSDMYYNAELQQQYELENEWKK